MENHQELQTLELSVVTNIQNYQQLHNPIVKCQTCTLYNRVECAIVTRARWLPDCPGLPSWLISGNRPTSNFIIANIIAIIIIIADIVTIIVFVADIVLLLLLHIIIPIPPTPLTDLWKPHLSPKVAIRVWMKVRLDTYQTSLVISRVSVSISRIMVQKISI